MKTSHELARALLREPDLPIYHFDPSRIDVAQEDQGGDDPSLADPVVEYERMECGGMRVIISGGPEGDEEEEDKLTALRDAAAALQWLEDLAATADVLIRVGPNGVMLVSGRQIFTGTSLADAIDDGQRDPTPRPQLQGSGLR